MGLALTFPLGSINMRNKVVVVCFSVHFDAWMQMATPTMTSVAPIRVCIGRSIGSFRTNQLVPMENTSDNALHAGTAMDISVCDKVT